MVTSEVLWADAASDKGEFDGQAVKSCGGLRPNCVNSEGGHEYGLNFEETGACFRLRRVSSSQNINGKK